MTSITGCAQNKSTKTTVSKNSLIGKTFEAAFESKSGTVARIEDGKRFPFGVTDYYSLRFEKDSVEITHRHIYSSPIQQSDESESKTYLWKLKNDEIIIKNFNDYEQLIYSDNKIIGKSKYFKDVIFEPILSPSQNEKQ